MTIKLLHPNRIRTASDRLAAAHQLRHQISQPEQMAHRAKTPLRLGRYWIAIRTRALRLYRMSPEAGNYFAPTDGDDAMARHISLGVAQFAREAAEQVLDRYVQAFYAGMHPDLQTVMGVEQ